MSNNTQDVVVVLTGGKQDRGTRATLAFGWACAALALGKSTTIYLTMDGTYWAIKGASKNVVVDGFEPLQEYITQFFDLGGEMLVCAPCSEYYCSGSSIGHNTLLDEATLTGLGSIVSKVKPTTSLVSF